MDQSQIEFDGKDWIQMPQNTFQWEAFLSHVIIRIFVFMDASRISLINNGGQFSKGKGGNSFANLSLSSLKPILLIALEQCFSTAGPRSGTGPWHQLYRSLSLYKKELTGRGLTKFDNHCLRVLRREKI
jgi:hypothetical protein